MQIILLETIETLGEFGDVVEVKNGYARNYLIPKRLAVRATAEATVAVEARRQKLIHQAKERLDVAKARADSAVKQLTLERKVIEGQERLFGSVSVTDIIQAAAQAGTELLRTEINMPDEPIKSLGDFPIAVTFHPEVMFEVNLTVVEESAQ